MSPQSLATWLTYLEQLHPKAIDLGLDRVQQVAAKLQLLPYPIFAITVTGTNGKGSCCTLLEKILQAQGYKVGVYTSPHLLTYNERVRINGIDIDDASLCETFAKIEQTRGTISLTYFEFGTLAALILFKQANLDIVILEVGMGGRLDAVNIIDADIAIISTVAIDHTEWLGFDRETIGFEKAGIMRSHKPVICGDFATPQSVIDYANNVGAKLYLQAKDFGYEKGTTWSWWSLQQKLENLPQPKIELQNAATVLKALELLPAHFAVSPSAITTGLEQVVIPGRFQIIPGPVLQIFDVAHNPAATALLAQKLQALFCTGRTLAVVAMLHDKDYENALMPLLEQIDNWFVGGLSVARGGSSQVLAECLHKHTTKPVQAFATVTDAYNAALTEAHPGDQVVIFGSFYTVAEALRVRL